MAEALKNIYHTGYIETLANAMNAQHRSFNAAAFTRWVQADDWGNLELKQRMRKISAGLHQFMALPYTQALDVLIPVSRQFGGGALGDYASLFFPDYVECYGLQHFDTSMPALAHFTQYSSAEFAVRPFIVTYGDKMMAQMAHWAESDNYYVRRLASEGCRPRLPWAMALPEFKQDPSAILPILERLKNDDELFVRRSVANNLNDIAKDNPTVTVTTAKRWLGTSEHSDWVVKHACRSLLKQGHPELMALFGFTPPVDIAVTDLQHNESICMGETFNFSFGLSSPKPLGKLRIEYGIDFMKSNGKLRRKVFQVGESNNSETHKIITKKHSFKPISTRRHYSGEHGLAIIINGHVMAQTAFTLKP